MAPLLNASPGRGLQPRIPAPHPLPTPSHLALQHDELPLLRQQHQQRHGQALLGCVALPQGGQQPRRGALQALVAAAVLALRGGGCGGHGGQRQASARWTAAGQGRPTPRPCQAASRGVQPW